MERLVNLLVALLDTKRPLTREELRQRVGGYSDDKDNFHRNFERDKDVLRQMGIPLVTEQVESGLDEPATGYRVPRHLYELPDPGLEDDELLALNLAVSAVALEGSAQGAATTALWKLAASSGQRSQGADGTSDGASPPAVDQAVTSRAPAGKPGQAADGGAGATGSGNRGTGAGQGTGNRGATTTGPDSRGTGASQGAGSRGAAATTTGPSRVLAEPLADVPADENVATLFGAVAELRVVAFSYNGVKRRVDPWRLSYRRGRWYLSGFDHGRQAERLFRVDRITGTVGAEALSGAFERPAGVTAGPPPAWRLGDDEETLVDLQVDAAQLPWALAAAGESSLVSTGSDGSGVLRLAVTNRPAFRSFVLGLLEHAQVLGPPEIRQEVIEWLCELARDGQRPGEPATPVGVP